METTPFGYSFGTWIKRRRKSLDLTQDELAQRVGCSPSLIYKIETDERRPSRQIAELLAQHLAIPPDQRSMFLKIARQEKKTEDLNGIRTVVTFEPAKIPKVVLPRYPTQFIGREHEIDIVVKQLMERSCRFLTLTGPGGVGKTRLAVEVAHQLEAMFPEGIYFVSLAGVDQAGALLPAIADALGMKFSGPADMALQLINFLQKKEILFILDNMEHLIAGSGLLGEILQQTPGVKLLLTSREPAHLQWEWIFEVQGLPVPEEVSAGALEASSAVALFIQRARQASYDFKMDTEFGFIKQRHDKKGGTGVKLMTLSAKAVTAPTGVGVLLQNCDLQPTS